MTVLILGDPFTSHGSNNKIILETCYVVKMFHQIACVKKIYIFRMKSILTLLRCAYSLWAIFTENYMIRKENAYTLCYNFSHLFE